MSRYFAAVFDADTWSDVANPMPRALRFKEVPTAARLAEGDRIVIYLKGIARLVAVLEIVRAPLHTNDAHLPLLVPVAPRVVLDALTAIPITELRAQLSLFQNLANPDHWRAAFRAAIHQLRGNDGTLIELALREAEQQPVMRSFPPFKTRRRPLRAPVALPMDGAPEQPMVLELAPRQETQHDATQRLLLELGTTMQLAVHCARNDRHRFGALSGLVPQLPIHLDQIAEKSLSLIDVLWLDQPVSPTIIAAFEVEWTSAASVDLMRLFDLAAVLAHMRTDLYIVAPEARRGLVQAAMQRPAFLKLHPHISSLCHFLPLEILHARVREASERGMLAHLKPSWIASLAEPILVNAATTSLMDVRR